MRNVSIYKKNGNKDIKNKELGNVTTIGILYKV